MTSISEIDDRIAKCRKILEADPNSQIFAALSDSYRKKGEFDKAFHVCQSGLKIHSSYGAAHVVMAKINLDRGLYDWAESEAKKAAKIDGWTRNVELLLAEILIYKGEFSDAIKLLTRLRQSDPSNNHIKKLLDIARHFPEEQEKIIGKSASNVISSDSNKDKVDNVDKGSETVEESSLDAAGLIEQAIEVVGIKGAMFVNLDGFIIESKWLLDMDSTLFGASFSEIMNDIKVKLFESSFGHLEFVLIETEDLIFLIARMKDGLFLFVADEDVNLGTVKMKIEKLLNVYRS